MPSFVIQLGSKHQKMFVPSFVNLVRSSKSNRAELIIGQLKAGVRRVMKDTGCPIPFWDYCLEWKDAVDNHTAKNIYQLNGQTPHFHVHGQEGDISALSTFGFYEFVYFRDHTQQFSLATEVLGRYLGPSLYTGNAMCCWILKGNGRIVSRRTIRPLTDIEHTSDVEIQKRNKFIELTIAKYGDGYLTPPTVVKDEEEYDPFADDEEYPSNIPEFSDPVDSSGKAINQQPAYDKMIQAEVRLPQNGEFKRGKVIGRSVDATGKTTGTYDENPILNSVIYDIEFPDGETKQYAELKLD
jgi:hypothetical protein